MNYYVFEGEDMVDIIDLTESEKSKFEAKNPNLILEESFSSVDFEENYDDYDDED